MALSIKTNRMLWGRAASRCSYPDCRLELVIDSLETDDPSLVGEAAHIVAEQSNGPRGDSTLALEQRNTYSNLILLCNVHHKLVDDQTTTYTVENLQSMKAEHEAWVRSKLSGFDPKKQLEDERWAGYIVEWQTRCDLDNWLAETSHLFAPIPEIRTEFLGQLDQLRDWLLSRVWPESGALIRKALENFRMVLNDLLLEFRRRKTREDLGDFAVTEQFYKIREWDEATYQRLLKQFEFHVDLIHDLTFELTRAANYVCDQVRESLDRTFRIEPGVLLVSRSAGMSWYTIRTEYRDEERTEFPYPGLKAYMDARTSRSYCVGQGQPPFQNEFAL